MLKIAKSKLLKIFNNDDRIFYFIYEIIFLEVLMQNYLIKKIQKEISSLGFVPKVSISINKGKSGYEYYYLENRNKTYISKRDLEIPKKVFYLSYLKKCNKILLNSKNLTAIQLLDKLDDLYNSLHPVRKCFFEPIVPTWEMQLKKWKNTEYPIKNTYKGKTQLETNNGEFVKSKTELTLADLFKSENIIYKYEAPLKLNNGEIVYPDFTFLCKSTRKEVYWEHFGLMSQEDYSKKSVLKLEKYAMSGITTKDNLIITFENKEIPLSKKFAKILIENTD